MGLRCRNIAKVDSTLVYPECHTKSTRVGVCLETTFRRSKIGLGRSSGYSPNRTMQPLFFITPMFSIFVLFYLVETSNAFGFLKADRRGGITDAVEFRRCHRRSISTRFRYALASTHFLYQGQLHSFHFISNAYLIKRSIRGGLRSLLEIFSLSFFFPPSRYSLYRCLFIMKGISNADLIPFVINGDPCCLQLF